MKKLFKIPFFAFFDPENKSLTVRIIMTLVTFLMLIVAGSCLGIMGLYFSAGSYKLDLFSFYMQDIKLVVLNTLPYVLICLLIWFISDRAWIGFLSSGVLCLVYSFSEYWKLVSRDDPIYAEDVTLIKEALQMSDSYVEVTWQMYLAVALVLLGTAVLFFFFRGKMPHFSLRIAMPAVIIAVCVFLYNGVYTSSEVYSSFKVGPNMNPWFDNNIFISKGGIYPFIYSIQNAFPQPPEDYNKSDAEDILKEYETDLISEDKRANVIVVMYEAFSDLSLYTDKITGEDPYEDFHKIQSESYCGQLVTNIFAGGTINSERCVMTGFSDLTKLRRTSWSYPQYFKEMGYVTDGAHAGYEAFYNRQNINKNLGFDDYRFIENYYSEFHNGIPMDEVYLPDVTKNALEVINSGEKLYSFNVTYQNHGPYSSIELKNETVYVPKGEMSDYDYYVVNNYLAGIDSTAGHMLDMVNSFRETDEPVVLVFFGDHKPWLGEGNSTYTALGIEFDNGDDESFYNYYNTEYLIWANDSAKEMLDNDFEGTGPVISPCYLMNVLFDQCGWEGPSFMKLSNEVMAEMPVVSSQGSYLVDGELLSKAELPEKEFDLLKKLKIVQYYLAQDSQGKLPE